LKEEITIAHNYQEIIRFLKDILLQMELQSDTKNKYEELSKFFKIHRDLSSDPTIESIFDCAVKTVFDMNVSLIILSTDTPKYTKTLSKFRPNCCIICATDDKKVYNHIRLIRGVSSFLYDMKSADNLVMK
jgi:pyruvate kinase